VEKTKVLITGSKGMLGSALVNELSSVYDVKGIDMEDCDITNKSAIAKTVEDYAPGVVLHAAAYTDVDGCQLNPQKAFAINAKGTENVAQAAGGFKACLFYISTDYVFDGRKDKPYTETDMPTPINIYGQSKLEGEKIIQSLLSKYLILRTSWLFGPNGKNFVTAILQKAKQESILKIVNDQFGSPTYTLDLARAIRVLLSSIDFGSSTAAFGIYNITNSGSCSWYEFAKKIISLKKLKTQILPITSLESRRPAKRPKMSILDNSKLKSTFKLDLRPWSEALSHFLRNCTDINKKNKS
jgi:dTDP-4-dehydrorhamnose reductase